MRSSSTSGRAAISVEPRDGSRALLHGVGEVLRIREPGVLDRSPFEMSAVHVGADGQVTPLGELPRDGLVDPVGDPEGAVHHEHRGRRAPLRRAAPRTRAGAFPRARTRPAPSLRTFRVPSHVCRGRATPRRPSFRGSLAPRMPRPQTRWQPRRQAFHAGGVRGASPAGGTSEAPARHRGPRRPMRRSGPRRGRTRAGPALRARG